MEDEVLGNHIKTGAASTLESVSNQPDKEKNMVFPLPSSLCIWQTQKVHTETRIIILKIVFSATHVCYWLNSHTYVRLQKLCKMQESMKVLEYDSLSYIFHNIVK
jgi:hypothetical protein